MLEKPGKSKVKRSLEPSSFLVGFKVVEDKFIKGGSFKGSFSYYMNVLVVCEGFKDDFASVDCVLV